MALVPPPSMANLQRHVISPPYAPTRLKFRLIVISVALICNQPSAAILTKSSWSPMPQ
jgi:hypothetical protein